MCVINKANYLVRLQKQQMFASIFSYIAAFINLQDIFK